MELTSLPQTNTVINPNPSLARYHEIGFLVVLLCLVLSLLGLFYFGLNNLGNSNDFSPQQDLVSRKLKALA